MSANTNTLVFPLLSSYIFLAKGGSNWNLFFGYNTVDDQKITDDIFTDWIFEVNPTSFIYRYSPLRIWNKRT